ncbi:MAG: hypothetical protein JW849_08190 [Phycisphaerae bacterium]|nr:hypothetical protein [Phycisphaerae bacterium]
MSSSWNTLFPLSARREDTPAGIRGHIAGIGENRLAVSPLYANGRGASIRLREEFL